jgi:hypothetical protein
MPTPHKFWRNDKTMEPSQHSRFGLTCAVLTEGRGEALLTWYREASLARTSVQQEQVKESTESDQVSGLKWLESSVKYDLSSSSWKTHLSLWEEVLPWSSVTLPKWGMTLSGALFRHPIAERPISAIDAGLWPTPCAGDANTAAPNQHTSTLGRAVRRSDGIGGLNPLWVEWLMGWPIGWTELKPLEMDKFREWQKQHSEF